MSLPLAFLAAGGSMLAKDIFSTAYLALFQRGRKNLAGLADGIGDGLLSVSILSATHGHGAPAELAAVAGMVVGSWGGTRIGDVFATRLDAATRHTGSGTPSV